MCDMHRTIVASLFMVAACGVPPMPPAAGAPTADAPAREVTYFEGTSTTTSPDGTTPFGPPVAVIVRRTVDPAAKTIEEYVVHPGEEHPATMTQREGAVFAVVDPKGAFSGTLTYQGPAWRYIGWTYDIQMTDGSGAIKGRGEASASAIKTEKQFVDPTGTPRVLIREDLRAIDEGTFQRRLAELLPAPR